MSYELGNTDTRLPSPCAGQPHVRQRIAGARSQPARTYIPAVALMEHAMCTMNIVLLLFLACVAGCSELHRSFLRRLVNAGDFVNLVAALGLGVSSMRNRTRSRQPIQPSWLGRNALAMQQPATRAMGANLCRKTSNHKPAMKWMQSRTAVLILKLQRC